MSGRYSFSPFSFPSFVSLDLMGSTRLCLCYYNASLTLHWPMTRTNHALLGRILSRMARRGAP